MSESLERQTSRFAEELANLFVPLSACLPISVCLVHPRGANWVARSKDCALPENEFPAKGGGGTTPIKGEIRRELKFAGPSGERWSVWICIPGSDAALTEAAVALARTAHRIVTQEREVDGLIEELGMSNECLGSIYEISQDLSLFMSPSRALARISERIERALGFSSPLRAVVWLLNSRDGMLFPAHAYQTRSPAPRPIAEGLAGRCLAQKRSLIFDRQGILRLGSAADSEMASATAIALAPMNGPRGMLGVLAVWHEGHEGFDSRHMGLIEAMANHAALAIESDRILQELISSNAVRQELEIAQRIQKTLLFSQPPRDMPRIEVAVCAEAARQVGGDFFDFIPRGEGSLDILIGDVMGKGIPAALIGATVKGLFQRFAHRSVKMAEFRADRLARVVALVHREIVSQLLDLESFVTACYAQVDTDAGLLSYVNCGQTNILRWSAAQRRVIPINDVPAGKVNLPLGLDRDARYEQACCEIGSGDMLLFYSDGVTESLNPSDPFAGEEILREWFGSIAELPSESLIGRIRHRVLDAAPRGELRDDFTCIAVRVTSVAAEGTAPARVFEFDAGQGHLARVRGFIQSAISGIPALAGSEEELFNLQLALTEAVTNILRHAYGEEGKGKVRLEIRLLTDQVQFRLFDTGKSFDPRTIPEPALDGTHESGYGLFLIRRAMDKTIYSRTADGQNCLTMIKLLRGAHGD
ncbi:SpoIIE family protein phosphatase [Candidatus Sumerlaeota bacterium]|nr:SpoIIE family protein phosphatase [Candidatus Sumerlaeota bacterium]